MTVDLPSPSLVLAGRFEPGEERRYRHVPFEVPPGITQLHFRYTYNDAIGSDPLLQGGNTLDIGLFDERGTAASGPGFRGWSGNARDRFTIDAEWATPPYRPGSIGAGTWHVLLGPYKIGPRGLDYRVEVSFDPGLPREEVPAANRDAPLRPLLPPAAEAGWLRGDLHCHTLYSDGDSSPSEVLRAAAEAGLDFLGITDHNAAVPPVAPPDAVALGLPLLIPGVEVTTYGGHWNAWGVTGWFDFREPSQAGVQQAMDAALDAGAFVSVNHPKPFGPAWDYPSVRGHHAVEIWNGPWERLNALALAHWDERLRGDEHLVAVGGSDTHRLRPTATAPLTPPRLGHPTTWIQADGSPTATTLLKGLRTGRCFISASPAGPQLYLHPDRSSDALRVRVVGAAGTALVLVSERGCVAAAPVARADWEAVFPYPTGTTYLRAQITDTVGALLAISNPIWRDEGHA